MRGSWRSRLSGAAGVGALVVGAGLVVTPPAGAAPVADVEALRAAVSALNGDGPAAEIELQPGVTYSLPGDAGCGGKDEAENENASGDLDVRRDNPLKIFTADGAEPAVLEMTCDAAGAPQRVIEVGAFTANPPGKLTLRNVVVRNGHAINLPSGQNWGGGVRSSGDVALENVVFESNTAGDGGAGEELSRAGRPGGNGGAVAVEGTLTTEGSTFIGNKAGNGGDGFSEDQEECLGGNGGEGGAGGDGGAVYAAQGLTITNSTFSANRSGNGGDGGDGGCAGFIEPTAEAAAALQVEVPAGDGGNGGVAGSGGAVQCGSVQERLPACSGPMTVRASTVSNNATGDSGDGGNGGDGFTVLAGGNGGLGGGAEGEGYGGGILFVGGRNNQGPTTLLVENSTVDGNSTGGGGAGGDGGTGGDAPTGAVAGAGGDAGDGGTGGVGGGIVAGSRATDDLSIAKLVHVTATDNGSGGAAGQAGQPGAAGSGGTGGDEGEPGDQGGGSLAFFGGWDSVATVVATSTDGTGPDCWTEPSTAAVSRSTDDTCFGAGNVVPFADLALGPLADNGGPTLTRLPAADSVLLDKVTGDNITLTVDQRGVGRPQAAGSDIGAVEVQLIDLAVTKTASAASVATGTAVTFTIKVKNIGTSSPQPGVTIEDPNCSELSAPTGDANSNGTLDPGEEFSYTCKATPTQVGRFTNTVTASVTDATGGKITRTASVDVQVTAPAAGSGAQPPLATTGVSNPTPKLMVGGWMILAGLVLVLMSRRRQRPATPRVPNR